MQFTAIHDTQCQFMQSRCNSLHVLLNGEHAKPFGLLSYTLILAILPNGGVTSSFTRSHKTGIPCAALSSG